MKTSLTACSEDVLCLDWHGLRIQNLMVLESSVVRIFSFYTFPWISQEHWEDELEERVINFQRREDEEAMQEQLDAVEAMTPDGVYPTSPPPPEDLTVLCS